MRSVEHLRGTLKRIARRGYKAYKDIRGEYSAGDLVLAIDHVQGDPFAAPSRIRLIPRDDARPRRYEVAAALNRLRSLHVRQAR